MSVSTPYGPLRDAPLLGHPVASPTRDAPSAVMQPLDRLMNARSAAPCMLLCREGPPSFRAPYPLASPLATLTGIIHSPNPRPIIGHDSLASVSCMLNPVEEEYLRTLHLTPQMARNAPQPLVSVTPQLQSTYIPPWPPVQSKMLPPMPPMQPVPMAPAPVPLMPVAPPQAFYIAPPVTPPAMPPQFVGQGYPPGGGALMPQYGHAPVQPYPNTYPPAYWPPYLLHYMAPQGGFNKDSETAKPNKFTGRDPSKLCPFIVSCVMAFDSRPCKFATNHQ